MQNASSLYHCHICMSSLAVPLFHKQHDFQKKEKKKSMNIDYVWIFSTVLSEIFLILRRTEWDSTINLHRFPCKLSVKLADWNETWISSTDFENIKKIYIFVKILSLRAELFLEDRRTDGLTDMMKLIVAFCSFVNLPDE